MSTLSSTFRITKRSPKSHGRVENEDGIGAGEKDNFREQFEGREGLGEVGFRFDA